MNIENIKVSVYSVPTDAPEADGTMHWDSTTMILVQAVAENGEQGLGYSYAHAAAALIVKETLAAEVAGLPVYQVGRAWERMVNAARNLGRPGVAGHAISAVDMALWDLKARAAGLPLFQLLGAHRTEVPAYGSGGFTTYNDAHTERQLKDYLRKGFRRVKIKIGEAWGTREAEDLRRVALAREIIGDDVDLFVDANGGYTAKQAVRLGRRFAREWNVTYFEEPVPSDHLQQLAFVRQRLPLAVAAGEYGYDPWYFRDMLRAGAVDILQADATRCLGVTGWLMAADTAYAFDIPFSAHTAPALHTQLGCVAPQLSHIEYFHDHARIEEMFFDGTPQVVDGSTRPDPARPGFGLVLKAQDAEPYRVA